MLSLIFENKSWARWMSFIRAVASHLMVVFRIKIKDKSPRVRQRIGWRLPSCDICGTGLTLAFRAEVQFAMQR